jgi:D-xylose transport system substrate-binding protein
MGMSSIAVAEMTIGVSWAYFQDERWETDEAAMKAAIEAAGGRYIKTDASTSSVKQISDVESLIEQGVDAIVLLATDSTMISPAVDSAINAGIPVLAYDRLIDDSRVFYLTFDNKEVGRLQARYVLAAMPKGRYAFIKGSPTDPNSDFLRTGQQEVLKGALSSGVIVNAGEAYTRFWQPAIARSNMEQILLANRNRIDAVVASNDGTAGAVIEALEAAGLTGVPVSGQDGDHAALNRVARGTQTVSVWKDARNLGRVAGEIAMQLADGLEPYEIENAQLFISPNGKEIPSRLLRPTAITRDNLHLVLEADWITHGVLCAGVPRGEVAACD